MSTNKADVTIFGQNYTISGELSEEQIITIASYVDEKMHELDNSGFAFTDLRLAVLSAVNIGQEYFAAEKEIAEMKEKLGRAIAEADEMRSKIQSSKDELEKYRKDSIDVLRQKDDFQKRLSAKEKELDFVKTKAKEEITKAQSSGSSKVGDLEAKCEELENNFFNIQMENIQLKKQLSAYQKQFARTEKE